MLKLYRDDKGDASEYYEAIVKAIDTDVPLTVAGLKPTIVIVSQYPAQVALSMLWAHKHNMPFNDNLAFDFKDDMISWLENSKSTVVNISMMKQSATVVDIFSHIQSMNVSIHALFSDTEHEYPRRRGSYIINAAKELQDDIKRLHLHTDVETHWFIHRMPNLT